MSFFSETILAHGESANLAKTVHIPGIQNRIHRIAVSPKSHTAYCSDINGVYIQYKNELHHYTNQNGFNQQQRYISLL
jgi:hypothetical protein